VRSPLSAFTVEAIAPLGGPEWLAERRAAAAGRLADATLPSTDEEVWRYSRIDDLDLGRFTAAAATSVVEHGDLGRARVVRASELDGAGSLLDPLPTDGDALVWLHHALAADPIVIDVPAGVAVADPIIVRHTGPADGTAAAVRLVVRAGADSEVRVVEIFEGWVSRARRGSATWARSCSTGRRGPSPRSTSTPPTRPRSPRGWPASEASTPEPARTAGSPGAGRRAPSLPPTSVTATRRSTTAPSRSTSPPTPPARCSSRAW
jgi:hypothetical protein